MSRAVLSNLETFIGNVPREAVRLCMRTKASTPVTLLDLEAKKVAAESPRDAAQYFHQTGRQWAEGQGGGEVTLVVQFIDEEDKPIMTTQFRVGSSDPDRGTDWEKGTPEGVISQLQASNQHKDKIIYESIKVFRDAYEGIIRMQQERIVDLEGRKGQLEADLLEAAANEVADSDSLDRLFALAEKVADKNIEKFLESKNKGAKQLPAGGETAAKEAPANEAEPTSE